MVCVVFWCVSLCFPPLLITAPSPNVSLLFLVGCLVFCYLSPCLSFVPRAVIVVCWSCVFSVVTCVPLLLAPCLSLLAEIKCSFP